MSKKIKTAAAPSSATSAPRLDPVADPKPAARGRRPARISIDAPSAKTARASKHTAGALKQASRKTATDATAPPMPRQRAIEGAAKHAQRGKAPTASRDRRPSALDAAARVLAGLSKPEAREGISAPNLIERMAKAKFWTSPGGKTPAATLYAAMIREINLKGKASRFVRVSPGRFIAGPAACSRAKVKG